MWAALRELDLDDGESSSNPSRPSTPPAGGGCGLVYDEAMLQHAACALERPDRLTAIMRHLSAQGLPALCEFVPARPCSESEARLVHGSEHWERLLGLPDAPLPAAQMESNEHTAHASRLAAGSVVELVERVCRGSLRSGFALVRPPGHHAGHSSMQGFCFLNNVAIAARVAQQRHGLARVLILDWDVHHGNGTEAMLMADPGIMYVSLHRRTKGFYPRTGDAADVGAGAGAGFTLNVPWGRTAMGDEQYMQAFAELVMPVAAQFDPQLVLVSAGFDAAHGDPLGEMHLTPSCYGRMVRQLQTLAGGRIVCALEGGYRLKSTATGVAATLRALLRPGEDVRADAPPLALDDKAHRAVQQSCVQTLCAVRKAQRGFWGVLHAQELPRRIGAAGGASASALSSARTSMRAAGEGEGALDAASAGAEEGGGCPALRALEVVDEAEAPGGVREGAHAGQRAVDTCRACGERRAKALFSKSQWRRAAAGTRTCAGCSARGEPAVAAIVVV